MHGSLVLRLGVCFVSFMVGSLADYQQNMGLYFVFTVLNACLGFLIFFFHCTCNETVRNWKLCLYHVFMTSEPTNLRKKKSRLKYGFCKKSLRKNETLTSWPLLAHFFSRSAQIQCWSGKKSEPKVFNWSEFHFSKWLFTKSIF